MVTRTDRSALSAKSVPVDKRPSLYPEPFRSMMQGREKRRLGDHFGLRNFGVNLTRLAPGAMSALRHSHEKQDELIYVLEGHPTLHSNAGKTRLSPGDCAGFPAGAGDAANLVNETDEEVWYLEIGDRSPGDEVDYPDDDLVARWSDGGWVFFHKDGRAYD